MNFYELSSAPRKASSLGRRAKRRRAGKGTQRRTVRLMMGEALESRLLFAAGEVLSFAKIAHESGGGPTLIDSDRFGGSVTAMGDLDGDGVTDLAVGARLDDTGGDSRGAVHVLLMNTDGSVKSDSKIAHETGGGPTLANFDNFGTSVTAVGDLDGDGVTDLAVGASGDDTGGSSRGAVHILLMKADGTAKSSKKIANANDGGPTLANDDRFGTSVAAMGDFDSDGVADLAVGASGDDTGGIGRNRDFGAVHVLLMNANGTAKSSVKIAKLTTGVPTLASSDNFGSSVTALGDLDGDGITDLAVGATGDDTGGSAHGAVYVLLMNANGLVKTNIKIANATNGGPTLADADQFGHSVALLGDLDGDGVVDLAVGAKGDGSGAANPFTGNHGAVHVLLLNSSGSVKDLVKISSGTSGGPNLEDDDGFGSSVANLGDIDGDGIVDLAVGAEGDATGGSYRGAVHVLFLDDADEVPSIISAATASVAENQTAVIDVQATDPEGETENGGGLSYSKTDGVDQALFALDANTGVLTFISAPDFDNPGDDGGNNIYSVQVSVTDSGGLTDVQDIVVTVTGVNEDPSIISAATATAAENQTAVIDVQATDPDGDTEGNGLTYSKTGGIDQALFAVDANTGVLTFIAAPDFEAPGDDGGNNIYNVQVTVTDSGGSTDVQEIVVTVTGVNEAPNIIAAATASVAENQTAVIDVQATDPEGETENGGGLSYSKTGGVDQALFALDANTGVLTFISAPDFDNPGDDGGNNIYSVQVTVTDSGGLTDVQDIVVTVTGVNEDPSIISAATATAAENQTAVIDVQATDPDGETENGGGLTYTKTGGADQALFALNANTGILTFIAAPDFEAPSDNAGDNIYNVQVTVTDSGGLTDVQDIVVTVTNEIETDFGDAPDTSAGTGAGNYETTDANGGPSHMIVTGLLLGATVDAEDGTLQNGTANADDIDGALPDDEDSVLSPLDLLGTVGAAPSVTLLATNTTGTTATLSGWIDFNNDGVFDSATERAQIAVPAGTTNGRFTLTFTAVPAASAGETYARFRLSTDAAADDATGAAADGEVEDYAFSITDPSDGTVASFAKIAEGIGGGPSLSDVDFFGFSMASLGDLDGDGVADLAVGANRDDTGGNYRGAVHVLLMNTDGSVKSRVKIASGIGGGPTLANGDVFGSSLAAVGDLDGDGVNDLAVGTLGDDTGGSSRGAVHVLLMNTDGTVKSSTKIAHGTGGGPTLSNNDYFGSSVTSLGDLDGDGVADLAVGAISDDTGGSNRGAVHVLLMNPDGSAKSSVKIASGIGSGPTLSDEDRFGTSLAGLGDLDGDGVADLAVGAFDDTGGIDRGAVHVLLMNPNGSVKSSSKIAHETGGGPTLADVDAFGISLAPLGDLDGDGVTDLAVGANADDTGGADRGAIHVLFMNADGSAKRSVKITSETAGGPTLNNNDNFGISLTPLGDLDGDGVTDLAVGAVGDDTGGDDRGAVYVLFLNLAAPPQVLSVELNADQTDPLDLPLGAQPTTWAIQRSYIASIQVTFSELVTMDVDDIRLTNLGINAPQVADQVVDLTSAQFNLNGSVLTLSFAIGDLDDGAYRIEVLQTVTDIEGNPLDGNGNGIGGDDFLLQGNTDNKFYQLEAEWSGDGGVSVFDFTTFSYWFGSSTIAEPFAPVYADLNEDDGVSVFDFVGFSDNFGAEVIYQPAFAGVVALRTEDAIPSDKRPEAIKQLAEIPLDDTQWDFLVRRPIAEDPIAKEMTFDEQYLPLAEFDFELEELLDALADDIAAAW